MTTVAVIGNGNVGSALAQRLLEAGATVRFGVRDPGPPSGGGGGGEDPLAAVPVMAPADAAAGAQIILLAVPAGAAVEAVRSCGDLAGTVLLDCTNPVRWEGGPVWAPPAAGSVAAALAAAFPGTLVVKGFNHFGVEIQRNPGLAHGPADAMFAGDDAGAKRLVMELAGRMGFLARDAGPLRNAALLENLAVLWIHLATAEGAGREFAFRLELRG